MGLASPPLTPPYNSDLVYKKNINPEKNTKQNKEKKIVLTEYPILPIIMLVINS